MVMPKKGTRKIEVDGRSFRWRLPPPRWGEDLGLDPKLRTATLTIQEDVDRPGRVAQVELEWDNGQSVVPEDVQSLIRRALKSGWDPTERGGPFRLPTTGLDSIPTKMRTVRSVMES
jgi:hypothetical protein